MYPKELVDTLGDFSVATLRYSNGLKGSSNANIYLDKIMDWHRQEILSILDEIAKTQATLPSDGDLTTNGKDRRRLVDTYTTLGEIRKRYTEGK